MEQVDFQYDKFNKSRYFVEKKQLNLQVKNNHKFSRSLYVNRATNRPAQTLVNRNQNKPTILNKDIDKNDEKNKDDSWTPWGR